MTNFFRIATWNVQRPKLNGWKNNPTILKQIEELNADILVLTETNSVINPQNSNTENSYFGVASPPIFDYHDQGENCTTIWSRYRIGRKFSTFNPAMAVCAEILSPRSFIVYGTIINYANDKGPTGTAKKWQEHYKSIALHGQDWAKLNQGLSLCVAGDFNQTLNGSIGYGTHHGREILRKALQQNELVCVTDNIEYNIDHICLSPDLAGQVNRVNIWQGFTSDGKPVSDHYGVSVDLLIPNPHL